MGTSQYKVTCSLRGFLCSFQGVIADSKMRLKHRVREHQEVGFGGLADSVTCVASH